MLEKVFIKSIYYMGQYGKDLCKYRIQYLPELNASDFHRD